MERCCTLSAGVEAATEILAKVHGIEKALDPLDPDDYLVIVERLAGQLRTRTGPIEAAAVRAALQALDVDWTRITPAQRAAAIEASREAIGRARDPVVRAARTQLRPTGQRVMQGSRSSVRRALPARFTIQPVMRARDRTAERFVRSSTTNFIRDEFGRRRDDLAELARETVARALEEGLGRDDIGEQLATAMAGRVARSEGYWQVVSGAFVNRARTYSQLLSYEEAGISHYIFEAVLDERTTDICRFYHGQQFTVGGGIRSMNSVMSLEDPEEIRSVNPWLRTGRDEDGNRVIWFPRDGERVRVAQVDRSGVGSRDDRGSFSRELTPTQLERAGVPYPPLHGRCRSIIVADV